MARILFVDDNQNYLKFLTEVLTLEGYQVVTADNAVDGLDLFKKGTFDLVISDLKMETIDGLKLLYLLRKIDANIKVILLTGSDSEVDEIQGLDLNVNDYIQKGISINVLLKRIEHILKQNFVSETSALKSAVEGIHIDLDARRVYKNETELHLTFKEYELLVLFLKKRNVVLDRKEIIAAIWGEYEDYIDVRIVDTHIKRLREKLRTSRIHTIRGAGYEWIE